MVIKGVTIRRSWVKGVWEPCVLSLQLFLKSKIILKCYHITYVLLVLVYPNSEKTI